MTEFQNKDFCKLSVIIPAYKFSKWIEQSVLSALFQRTNFKFEVIVRDDGSNDGTIEILKRLETQFSNLVLLDSSQNLGGKGFGNIKELLLRATGEYISYLDGDDYFTDLDKLQKQVDFLDSNPKYVIHSAGAYHFDGDGQSLISDGRWVVPVKSEVCIEDILGGNIISFGKTFRDIPNILQDWQMETPFIDWTMSYNLLKHGKAKCEDWPCGVYRIHNSGTITGLTGQEIEKLNNDTKNLIKLDYLSYKNQIDKNNKKSIAIIDCFVSSPSVEAKLSDQISRIKAMNIDVLLVSNTKVSSDILQVVDYFDL